MVRITPRSSEEVGLGLWAKVFFVIGDLVTVLSKILPRVCGVAFNADHPELYKNERFKGGSDGGDGGEGVPRRQAATDVIMLERFRKRERNRAMRR